MNGGGKTSPGLLNKIPPSVIPAGTFIPISVSFESISCAAKSSSEVSRNFLQTFQEALKMSPNELPSGKAAVISLTSQYRRSPTQTSFDDYLDLMINKEVETDSCITMDMNTQTEVEPVNPNAESDKTVEQKSIPKFEDNQTQTDLIVDPVNPNEESDNMEEQKSIPQFEDNQTQTDLISIDVIDKKEEVKKPIIEVTENKAQTELIAAHVIDKKEEMMIP